VRYVWREVQRSIDPKSRQGSIDCTLDNAALQKLEMYVYFCIL